MVSKLFSSSMVLALALSASSAMAADASAPAPAPPKPAAAPKTPASTARTERAPAVPKAPAAAPAAAPAMPAAPSDELVVLETTAGEVVIDLFEDKTPGHAENMKKLVRQGFYDGSPFHRVIAGFMAQGGGQWGPNGQIGDSGYTQPAEIVPELKHERGSVAAARTPDFVNPERRSSGSQFYICFGPTPNLDGQYTVFGKVVSGMDAVDKLVKGDPNRNGVLDAASASKVLRAWLKAKDAAPAAK